MGPMFVDTQGHVRIIRTSEALPFEGDAFLWHFEPIRKPAGKQWRHPTSSWQKNFVTGIHW